MDRQRRPGRQVQRTSATAQEMDIDPNFLPNAREWSAMREEVTEDTLTAVVAALKERLQRDIEHVKPLGSGAFADVLLARAVESGAEFAVKISVGAGNMSLLQRESRALAHLNSLDGSSTHVAHLHLEYMEVDVPVKEGSLTTMGLFVLENGLCDLDCFVREKIDKDIEAAARGLEKWEESLKWLHSHGILHLDIKAENAVVFPDGAIKLIDTTGVITRYHTMDEDTLLADEVTWDTALLAAQEIPYISTDSYVQPAAAGPGGRVVDYSADWWSMGVSKLDVLGVDPALFDDGTVTGDLVLEGLNSGELEAATRRRLAEVLGAEPDSDQVSSWVHCVMENLRGSASNASLTA